MADENYQQYGTDPNGAQAYPYQPVDPLQQAPAYQPQDGQAYQQPYDPYADPYAQTAPAYQQAYDPNAAAQTYAQAYDPNAQAY